MKILAVGDLHGDTRQAKKLADRASKENVDLVILSGDLSYGEESIDGIVGPFKEKGKPVFLIPGNHESDATADFLAMKYGAVNLHGTAAYLGDVGFFGCGSANVGIFQMPEKDIYVYLKRGFEKIRKFAKKIMVTHVHPEDSLMDELSVFGGSKGVREAIDRFKPDLAICSHVHEAEGVEEVIGSTKLVNVGKSGKIIEV